MMAPARVALLAMLPLLLVACAGFHQGEFDEETFRERAVVLSDGPVTLSAAVPDAQETEHITGLDLYDQGIQPVWLEVTNQAPGVRIVGSCSSGFPMGDVLSTRNPCGQSLRSRREPPTHTCRGNDLAQTQTGRRNAPVIFFDLIVSGSLNALQFIVVYP